MFTFMKNWYKTKKTQMALKAMFYGTIMELINNQKEVTELIQKIYVALKDVPGDELQQKIVEQIAVLAHESNKN